VTTTAAYLRVAAELRREILDGSRPPRERLPSRSELARRFGVGQNVAIAAVRVLMAEGLVEGRAGSGVYVRAATGRLRLQRSSATGIVRGAPIVVSSGTGAVTPGERETTSATAPAPPGIADRLGVPRGAPMMRTEYLFSAAGERTMMSTSWEPLELTGGTAVTLPNAGPLAGEGVVERMSHIGIEVDRSVEAVSARLASAYEANRLAVPAGSIVEVIERVYYAGDRPVETADIVVAASRYQMVYEIPVSARHRHT
jgi:GntR family transcriptional regulator